MTDLTTPGLEPNADLNPQPKDMNRTSGLVTFAMSVVALLVVSGSFTYQLIPKRTYTINPDGSISTRYYNTLSEIYIVDGKTDESGNYLAPADGKADLIVTDGIPGKDGCGIDLGIYHRADLTPCQRDTADKFLERMYHVLGLEDHIAH
jgi:hypothetical protein